jgi:hypothetical protein
MYFGVRCCDQHILLDKMAAFVFNTRSFLVFLFACVGFACESFTIQFHLPSINQVVI